MLKKKQNNLIDLLHQTIKLDDTEVKGGKPLTQNVNLIYNQHTDRTIITVLTEEYELYSILNESKTYSRRLIKNEKIEHPYMILIDGA